MFAQPVGSLMATGLPLHIATKRGGMPEAITHRRIWDSDLPEIRFCRY